MSRNIKRTSRINPVDLLREFTINKKEIKKKDNFLYFDSMKFDMKTITCWKSKILNQNINLGSIWLFLQKHEQNMSIKDYFNKRYSYGLDQIQKGDEEEILGYFTGKIEHSECFDNNFKLNLQEASQQKAKEAVNNENNSEQITKKQKLNDPEENIIVINWISKTEKPINSKTRMLRAKNNNTNFKIYLKYLEEGKTVGNTTNGSLQTDSAKQQINYPCFLKDLIEKKAKPIIVVPSMGRAGNISLFNAKQFMADGDYKDPENKYYESIERTIQIEKEIKGYKLTFEIYDNVGTFERRNNNKGKWDRVVAVFVTGQKYQFKSWPLENNIPTQLDQIRGFYLKYSEMPVPEQVGNWNVKVLDIYRHKRHLDKAAHDLFWTELENFLTQPRIQKEQK